MSYDDYQTRLRAVYQTDSNTRLRVPDKSTTLLLIHRLGQFVHITKPSACDRFLVILVDLCQRVGMTLGLQARPTRPIGYSL